MFMEILSTQNPRITSLLSNRYPIKIHKNNNPPRPIFKFPLQTSSFRIRSSKNHRFSANLDRDRPTGRRKNHLRKKLIEQQVLKIDTHLSNLGISDDGSVQIRDNSSSSNKCLSNQLENRDAEFCPNPVFTVSQNSNVKLDNQNVKHNRFHATIASFTGKPGLIGKIPSVGVSLFCLFIMFKVLNKYFTKEKEEISSLEKEMLRRKIKSRMVKENSIKGSVEVIQESKEPEMVFKEKPQLDKEELMNSIVKVNAYDDTRLDKSQEIKAMARELDTEPDDVNNITDIVAQGIGSKKSVGKIISSVKEAREYLNKKETVKEDVNLFKCDENENKSALESSDVDIGRANREKWIEDNFHEFEPLVDKIRGGFRNNYMVAREKVKEDENLVLKFESDEKGSELEWMKDEKLREIVFQVRENELMGRDPFYLMDTQDKELFFKGLEKKVEKVNEELAHLHQYLHSNIENLDYGADGISLYDSPEKIIPRWKGPPPTTPLSQESLDDYTNQRKSLFAETLGNLDLNSQKNKNETKISKTVIEGSDGSIKPVKKSGKEFWQHTKKWSRGFIDSYNAENDPETKAVMKDIGKDLDRWITEKEIQDVADVMDKVPEKGKKFIEEKISKLKREMELFGPQAVVSKYREYGDEEEEIDYYWWLDLPFLLCIEMYIYGDEDERIGFYSLEMASDLELDPKPHHIIAFEDASDCKNLCYIIQAHMEMLGNGNAFVVPQLPKDTYKEAKTNGFNVTVIRKGELKLNVDQTLEEVEEKIVEIGSKMYHDKIMKSRNVDVDAVMKGVFGLEKTTSKRRRLKRPTK